MSMAFVACGMILWVTTQYATKLSVWTNVGGWGVPFLLAFVTVASRVCCWQKGTQFCFDGQGHHMLEHFCLFMDGTIIWQKGNIGGHENMSSTPASCFGLTEVWGITMGGEYHVTHSIHDYCIGISCCIIQELFNFLEGVFGRCCLLTCYLTEGREHCAVQCPGIR